MRTMYIMNRYAVQIGLSMILIYVGLGWYLYDMPYLNVLSINILQSLAALYAALMFIHVYRHTRSKYWFYYFLGVLCYMFAQWYWTCYLIIFGVEPSTFGIPELVWMVQYVFYIMALYNQNITIKKRPALRFILDVLLFTTVSATMYWRLLIEPLVSKQMLSDEEVLFNLFCSSANAVILFGLLILYIYERISIQPKATLLLMIGFFMKSCGNTAALFLNRDADWSESLSWIPELCWFIGLMLFVYSPIANNKIRKYVRSTSTSSHYILKRYVPLILVFLMIVAFLWSAEPLTVTLFGLIFAFVLLLIRLFVGIQDYKSADDALQESVHNYRNLVEHSLVGVFIEQDNQLVYVNPYCERLFGYELGEMIGNSISDYVCIAERLRIQEEFSELGVKGSTPRLCFECNRKDQSVVYVDLQAATTLYQGREAISGTLLDITESKLSEQLLIQSEKLSVVGQLAAGVAHEIRNPLTALKGFTQLLYQKSDGNQNYYEIMLMELDRINYIVGEFMILSKPSHLQRLSYHDLQQILSSIIPIIESQAIIHSISIQVEWNIELQMVLCDANQIKQVFINLLKNSIEAMPEKGSIYIRFENASNKQVLVSIEDEGIGIPEEIINRLGEPFFSTKDTGTGLGLMVCYKIIQAHGGSLIISSQANRGTVVQIALPADNELLKT